jgi:hypothetical protein
MLEYGGMGAAIGSIIPGVGTVVGAGVGAAVGAVVENWDSIVKTAGKMWEMTKKAGRTIGEAASWLADGVKTAGKAIWSHFFGNDVRSTKRPARSSAKRSPTSSVASGRASSALTRKSSRTARSSRKAGSACSATSTTSS